MFDELRALAGELEIRVHLAICPIDERRFEVVAIGQGDQWGEAFPLPLDLQGAAGSRGFLLENRFAARLELEQYPTDFWEDVRTEEIGSLGYEIPNELVCKTSTRAVDLDITGHIHFVTGSGR